MYDLELEKEIRRRREMVWMDVYTACLRGPKPDYPKYEADKCLGAFDERFFTEAERKYINKES